MSQSAAVTSNIALLAFRIAKKAEELALPPEDQSLSNAADTILNLCATQAVCLAWVLTWMTVLQLQMWLHCSSSIPEEIKKELLEGHISLDRLLSPHFQSSDMLEQVWKHLVRPRSIIRTFQPPGIL